MKVYHLRIPVSAVDGEPGDPDIRLMLVFIYAGASTVERRNSTVTVPGFKEY